jgi:hypothetical protein
MPANVAALLKERNCLLAGKVAGIGTVPAAAASRNGDDLGRGWHILVR